ncbi:IS21 family transposase [Leptospirillum ferriphilum]|uniref:IS21 family transposase n=1 Tax=Leptospirillum ferriphilum TaxID=178606 RepID=UPI001C4DDEFD|nr:IS21 family transposase [Leptospirillum ferriphilum]
MAIELGVHPRTIRRALDRGGPPHDRAGRPRNSKLDPYRNRVDARLSEGVWNSRVILREIEALGYSGGYSILSDYLRPKGGLRPGRATVRFETEPGEQLQNDWGELWVSVGGIRTKVYVSVNTLGSSRRFHVWAALRMDAEHTYEGLIRGFEHLGGVTREVLVDNQKAMVIAHRAGSTVVFHPGFLDLAGHYGFVPKACRPYRARTKGKDERMVRYVKENFFQRYRTFEDWPTSMPFSRGGFGRRPTGASTER